jgi:7-cyano-7-deazaguanine synthase
MGDLEALKVMVLLSGGVDSTACVGYYIRNNYQVYALFIDYGQHNSKKESDAATAVAEYYNIPLSRIVINPINVSEGYIPGRNAVLLSLALMNCPFTQGIVSLGIHSGTSYPDCSPEFESLMQRIYLLYEEGRIRIDAPFLKWEKSEIVDFAQTIKVPLHLTFSTNQNDMPLEYKN